MQKGRKSVTFAIRVRIMWYEEKVSNIEIAAAKLNETLGVSRNSFLVFVSDRINLDSLKILE